MFLKLGLPSRHQVGSCSSWISPSMSSQRLHLSHLWTVPGTTGDNDKDAGVHPGTEQEVDGSREEDRRAGAM